MPTALLHDVVATKKVLRGIVGQPSELVVRKQPDQHPRRCWNSQYMRPIVLTHPRKDTL